MQIQEQELGERTGLWMVTLTTWVRGETAEQAASRLTAALPSVDGYDPEVDIVTGWDPKG